MAQRNIDVLSAEKKVDGRLDDLQTNGLRASAESQVDERPRENVHEKRRGKGETQRIQKHHRGFQSKMSFNLQNETKDDQQ